MRVPLCVYVSRSIHKFLVILPLPMGMVVTHIVPYPRGVAATHIASYRTGAVVKHIICMHFIYIALFELCATLFYIIQCLNKGHSLLSQHNEHGNCVIP